MGGQAMNSDLIPLADAISALREQLAEAQRRGEGESLRFEVGPVEVTFQVVATIEQNASGKASVGFQLFGFGAEGSAARTSSDARTHSVTVSLTPKFDGRTLEVSDSEGDFDRGSDP